MTPEDQQHIAIDTTAAEKPQSPKIFADIASSFTYASYQNAIPVLRGIGIENRSDRRVDSLQLELSSTPAFLRPKTWTIDRVIPGDHLPLGDRKVELDAGYLAGLNEAERGEITLRLIAGSEILDEHRHAVRLLARDEWGGVADMAQLLPAFVMPNDRAVSSLLRKAAERLAAHGHPSGLDGYQSQDPKRAFMLAAAVYSAIASMGLHYAEPPASFESRGQKIRRPGTIAEEALATCLDTTLLFAAALEAAGLHPVILMFDGHAAVGVWLTKRTFGNVIETDQMEVRKALASRELIVFETTGVTHRPAMTMEAAQRALDRRLAEEEAHAFVAAIDVRRARSGGITPLASHEPLRRSMPEDSPQPVADLPLPPPPSLGDLPTEMVEEKPTTAAGRIDRWQKKLLDLTLRNRLLNFPESKKTIPFLCTDVAYLEDRLAEGAAIRVISLPEQNPLGERAAALYRDVHGRDIQRTFAAEALLRDELPSPLDARQLETRLAELDRVEDRDERKRAIEAAQAAFDAAKSQSEILRAAEAELRLMREQRDNTDRALKDLRTALERAAGLKFKLGEAEHRRAEALANRDAVAAAASKAHADIEASEKEEQEARALLSRLDAALNAREAAGRLADLEQKLEAAETIRKEIEQEEAALALLRLPEKAVTELEALDVEIAKFRAVAEAGRPSLAIAYEPQAPVVSLDGEPLRGGEPLSYDGQAELAIPGIGVVTLRSSRPAGGDERLRQTEERRRVLLASIGVDDLAAARKRQVEAQGKEGDLREKRTRLSLLAPDGLPKLREDVTAHRVATDEVLELKEDPAQARAAHEAAEAKRLAARQAWRAVEPMQAGAADAVIAAQTAFTELDAERIQVEAILGPEATRAERQGQMAARLAGLDNRLAEQQALVDRLQEEATDLASADAMLRRLRSVAEAAEKEVGTLREEIAGLAAEIRARSEDAVEEKWRESVDALSAAKMRVASYEKEVAVLQRLRSALETARGHARETYLLPVMNELRPLLGLLFDDVSISFDEKTLLPHKIVRKGQEEDVERLSGGMREQLSVLTRLAFARLLAKDGRPTPVILDDALVYSDDDRIEKMFDALHRQAREQQIIVFSCRQRAFQKLGGNVLQMLDWIPDE